ncbi:hypothetical protein V1478_014404 [Vespula squamosa]|uniref:Uncharacterized protein n=1 Tax=Vespula squamosa TaxID=30214 RepID=A0ABD2A7W7_VESSQ
MGKLKCKDEEHQIDKNYTMILIILIALICRQSINRFIAEIFSVNYHFIIQVITSVIGTECQGVFVVDNDKIEGM